MFFKDFVSVKRKKIKKGASQTYDTPSHFFIFKIENDKNDFDKNDKIRTSGKI